MISLKEVFMEAGEEAGQQQPQKKVKKKPQPQMQQQQPQAQQQAAPAQQQAQPQQKNNIPSLAQLAKQQADPTDDLPKFDKQPSDDEVWGHPDFSNEPQIMYKNPQNDPKTQQDPDFLKAIQKGLNNLKPGNPVREPEQQPIPTPMQKYQPNDDIPSLAQLAKGAEEPEDPALAGLPKFDQQPEEDPFGNPDFQMPNQQAPDGSQFQTLPQRTASAVKKTIGQAAAGAGNALRNFGKDRGAAPSPAMAKTNNPAGQDAMAGLPPNWKTDPEQDVEKEPATGTEPKADDDMPTLRSLSKQRFGRDVFKDTSSKWRVGDIVRVGTQDGFKVQRKDPNGWVITRKGQNYKFIPHGGLFKV